MPPRDLSPALRTLGSRSARHQSTAGARMISGQSGMISNVSNVRQPQTRSTEPSDRGALFQTHISAGHPARHCAGTYWGHPARHATWPCPRGGRAGDDTTDQDRHRGQAPPTAEHSPVTCTRTESRHNPPGDTQHKISARNRNSGLRRLSGRPSSCRPQTSLEAADWLQRCRWCPLTAACRPGC